MSFYFYDTPYKKNFHSFLNNSILNSPNYGNGYDRKYNDGYRYGNFGNINQKNPMTSSPTSLFKYTFFHPNEANKLSKTLLLRNNENSSKNDYHFSGHPLFSYYNPLPYQNNFSNNYSYDSLLHYGNGNNDFSNSFSNLLNLKKINSTNTNNKNTNNKNTNNKNTNNKNTNNKNTNNKNTNNNNNNNKNKSNNQTITFSYSPVASPITTLQKSSCQKNNTNQNKISNNKSLSSKSSTTTSPKTSTSVPSSPKSSSTPSLKTNTLVVPPSQKSLIQNLTSKLTPNPKNLRSKFSQNSYLKQNLPATNSTSESNHPEPFVSSQHLLLPNKRSPSEQVMPTDLINSSPKSFLKQFSTPNVITPTSLNTFFPQKSLPKSYRNVNNFNFNDKDPYRQYNDISTFNKNNDSTKNIIINNNNDNINNNNGNKNIIINNNDNDAINNTENVPISPISANTETQENPIMKKPYSSSFSSSHPYLNTNSMIGFRPKSDLYEDDKAFYIHLDLPGMARDQIHIELLEIHGDRTLYISGVKQFYQNPSSSTLSTSSSSSSLSTSLSPSPSSIPSNSSRFYPNGENLKISKLGCEFGKFFRSFSIPESTNLEKIEARMENGALEVILPKMELPKHERRIIEVK